MTKEYTKEYHGSRYCERCKSGRNRVKAVRIITVPDNSGTVLVCRSCANVWNEAVDTAIANIARKVAAGEPI